MTLYQPRLLPKEISELTNLALDLFWTWSHSGDAVWWLMDPALWSRTHNPWVMLQDLPRSRIEALSKDPDFRYQLEKLVDERRQHLKSGGWFEEAHPASELRLVAYFSMEFGLSEALPIYAGGLGILAGDFLKAASDLGAPVVGVGLLFQEGYFRQFIEASGEQEETYPFNEPSSMPIQPVQDDEGSWLRVSIELPGRTVLLRLWRAIVGRATLYLLDSNDPLNAPIDRGITSKLYGGGTETRFLQEMALGIGGWRALEAQGLDVDICHLNEGHAAFVVLERIRSLIKKTGLSFREALWATRAGNVFTTHTPVPAGFDTFEIGLLQQHLPYVDGYLNELGVTFEEVLSIGRADPNNASEPFNMAHLAIRGSAAINAVSRSHGAVSRRLFKKLYPRWPEAEIPIAHITNGVHMPSWDSALSDEIWTESCGKERWLGTTDCLAEHIEGLPGERLWAMRGVHRETLTKYVRARNARQLHHRGLPKEERAHADQIFDANTLTLGFARRFTEYKRPTLLLRDPERLLRILTDPKRPAQLVVAGKAHPHDIAGKRMVREWIAFASRPDARRHVVFLEDYDISVAQVLVQGVDVWLNTPRRPWEACGTSGMKVLVNGGLNLSELEGWWAEAYAPEVGWALGDALEHDDPDYDAKEAETLYRLLEDQVIPAFYDRDSHGLPQGWIARMRKSMATLAPQFSSNRMMREYVELLYLKACETYRARVREGAGLARDLAQWEQRISAHWQELHLGALEASADGDPRRFRIPVYLGEVEPDWVRVQLYAEKTADENVTIRDMTRKDAIAGAKRGYFYEVDVSTTRPLSDFTVRILPYHPDAMLPAELPLIRWL